MKKILGVLGILLAVAAVAVLNLSLRRPHVQPNNAPMYDPAFYNRDMAIPKPAPDVIPAAAPAAPIPKPVTPANWGVCGSHSGEEDSALAIVLASRVENDPLFGESERTMEAASCAAYRWRLEGR